MSDPWRTEQNANAMGGTELIMTRLYKELGHEFLDDFQIVPSRKREIDPNKIRVFFAHDLPDDPESEHLANGGHAIYHRLVFVSHWQQQAYIKKYDIPWHKTIVLKNAIDPIDVQIRPEHAKETVDIIYHTTPHRGLDILVPVFEKLHEKYPQLRLHVYSSFKIYGWEDRDKEYQALFDKIDAHPAMTRYGTVSNEEIRRALPNMDIFAYPSTWPETSCLSLIEAMSAGLLCVHSNYGALYETASNWTLMYNFVEDKAMHANIFYGLLEQVVEMTLNRDATVVSRLTNQKMYADSVYNWADRSKEWRSFLDAIRELPKEMPRKKYTYARTV